MEYKIAITTLVVDKISTLKMKAKDPANPTKGELKHLPDIKIGASDTKGFSLVEVNIGQKGIIHPSTAGHL